MTLAENSHATNCTNWSRVGSVLLAIAVMCGAFGAHGLRGSVSPERLVVWEKAVLYQLIHGIAFFALGLSGLFSQTVNRAATTLLCGIIVFSGTLYLLVLTDTPWLGAVTPLGGSLMIVGWLWMAHAVGTAQKPLRE